MVRKYKNEEFCLKYNLKRGGTMLNDNLYSINKLQNDIKTMGFLSGLLSKGQRIKMKELENQISYMNELIASFNSIYSDYGWCAYDSMNMTLMERSIKAYKEEGLEVGERVLIEYYKNDVKDIIHWLKNKAKPFMERNILIQKAFDDHFAGRYYASVPLFLIIIDGSVNDYTKSKGFFAEGTDVTAWDCLVGCSDGLTKLKDIFNKGRNKTNNEEIRLPYRNGILHGRDLNYGNECVSCKCVALMFAIADWVKMKDSEDQRKIKFEQESNPPSISESIKKMKQNTDDKKEIQKWKKREVNVSKDISANPSIAECNDYLYLVTLVEAFEAWKNKNYGMLSIKFKNIFTHGITDGKRAGECREMFESKNFISFEIKEVEERACALTRVLVQVKWCSKGKMYSEPLEFGCVYQDDNEKTAFPWRGNGEWVLIPWKIQGLYKI